MKPLGEMVPLSIVQGDTLSFIVPGTTHLPPDWALKFAIQCPTPVVINASAEGSNFRVAANGTVTGTVPYGRWGYCLSWSNAGTSARETEQVSGSIIFLPDPLSAMTQSPAMQSLTKIEAAILKVAGTTNASVDVDGQTYTKRNFAELLLFRDRLASQVESELAAIGRGTGRGGARTIRTLFVP